MAETGIGLFEARQPSTFSQDRTFEVRVSNERMVGVHLGGQFTTEGGAEMVARHFGILGVLVWHLFFKKREERKRLEAAQARSMKSLEELALSDPKNFEVRLGEITAAGISRVRFTLHGPAVAELKLERAGGEPLRLLLRDKQQAAACRVALSRVLPDRLVVGPGVA